MAEHPMVKKIAEMMGRKATVRVSVNGELVAVTQGPISRSVAFPGGTSIKVLRRDAFERAIERVREVA